MYIIRQLVYYTQNKNAEDAEDTNFVNKKKKKLKPLITILGECNKTYSKNVL